MKSFYVGVKAIVENDNKILLLKRSPKKTHAQYFWDVPGGRIDGEETIDEAMKRELSEEIGFTGAFTIEKVVHTYRLPFDVENKHGLLLVYYKVSADVSEVQLSEEHSEFRWIAKEDLPTFFEQEADTVLRGGVRQAIELSLQLQ